MEEADQCPRYRHLADSDEISSAGPEEVIEKGRVSTLKQGVFSSFNLYIRYCFTFLTIVSMPTVISYTVE